MAAVQDLQGANLYGCTHERGMKFGVNVQALAAPKTLTANDAVVQVLDPAAATQDVLLPPEERGLFFFIVNTADALEPLVVKDDTGVTTVGTVTQDESALFVCDGVAWHSLVGANT